MSERYSDSRVVAKEKGEPRATDQPRARSVARPSQSWWMAKEALMPAPSSSLPCSYSRRTEGPMPLGATSTTEMSSRNSTPSFCMTPRRKPWESPRQEPGLQLGLRGVRDEDQEEVRLGGHVKDVAERPAGLGEARRLGLRPGRRLPPEADLDLGLVGEARRLDRVAQVLGLGGALGAPAQDADRPHALEGLREEVGQLAALPAHDLLRHARHLDRLGGEDRRLEVHRARRPRPPRRPGRPRARPGRRRQ